MHKLPITFIIPYKRDCSDRERNLRVVVHHLLHNYDAKIIVFEADEKETISSILPEDDRITCMFEYLSLNGVFHRTRYLNMMLAEVTTPIVANYDVDVMFDPKTIDRACSLILNDEMDVVYPYGAGTNRPRPNVRGPTTPIISYGSRPNHPNICSFTWFLPL